MTKEESSSPTVAIESLMLSCIIDAKEHRDVATVDIPGAFMHTDMDEDIYMKIDGKMAELLSEINASYRSHVTVEHGKKCLNVRLKKALYGTLKAALLFWKHRSSKLAKMGFKSNPYDSYMMTQMIDGAICTILWHVDDLKISHISETAVTRIIEQLEGEFGQESPLTVNRGKTHEYFGMKIDYNAEGKVKITMSEYISNMLDDAPGDMLGESATPAGNHLFQVNADAKK
jgi:hypothetical protein